ncbi:MAG: fructosamine kinase family protein [Gammaproteobacteria bacterium]|nr:fructosamine kinase family protein [Gammaproteobacteria bacterium]
MSSFTPSFDWSAFSKVLSEQLNRPIHIETVHPISGGDIHAAFQLHCGEHNYFLKCNKASLRPLLETEHHSLTALNQSHTLSCPTPIASGIYNNQAWLLMDFIPLQNQGDEIQRGRSLAHLHHQVNQHPQPFGWFEDNFIGFTPQQNGWRFEWVDFYAQQRLLPQLELAQLRGAPSSLYVLGIELIEALPQWFTHYEPEASLLHGDLWAGNSGFDANGDPVFFDPASYYGDREIDLAMSELFGGFSEDFYTGYQQIFPLDKGYQQRKALYQLYPILNHFNQFGGHYADQAEALIKGLLNNPPSP